MNKIEKYIYGVIPSNAQESFDSGAYTISFQDISAVVSDSEIVDFHHISKETLARLLIGHQQQIEKVMAKHSIIPMKLGTFAASDDEVRMILSKGYKTIKGIFEKAKGSIEFDVVATLGDLKSFLLEVSENDEIKQLKQSLLNKEGGVTLDDQMSVGVLIKKHLDEKKETLADQIRTGLGEITLNSKVHDLMDDMMVLNVAFLVDQTQQTKFAYKLDDLNEQFQEKLNFRCVGPLAPYSFYTLEVKKLHYEEIDWARKTLDIKDDFITTNEIKKAHRKSALNCHPDINPDEPDIEKKFDEMTKAYKLLLDYCGLADETQQKEGCCLNEQAFEKRHFGYNDGIT